MVVMGAVTQPWDANVVFRPLAPDEFVAFTDPGARAKFRRYWSFFSPGIKLIRWLLLVPLRNEERRARYGGCHVESRPL